MCSSADPFVQIRLSDLLALQAAATAQAPAAFAPLAPAPPAPALPAYLTTAEAAELLRMSRKSLEGRRARGEGPPCIRIGRAVRYKTDAVLAWLEGESG